MRGAEGVRGGSDRELVCVGGSDKHWFGGKCKLEVSAARLQSKSSVLRDVKMWATAGQLVSLTSGVARCGFSKRNKCGFPDR